MSKKKQRGRPKSDTETRTRRAAAMITPTADKRVRYLAKFYRVSVSDWLAGLIEKELKREGGK